MARMAAYTACLATRAPSIARRVLKNDTSAPARRPRPRRRRHPSPPRPRTTPQISKTILVVAFRRHPPLDAALPRVFASRFARARAVAARPRNRGTPVNSAPHPHPRLGRVRCVPILVREGPPRARDVQTSRPRARGAIDRRARDVLERGAGESRARRTREGRPVDNRSSSPRDDSTASARERRRDRREGTNSRSRGRV